jgi:hypothetical protein
MKRLTDDLGVYIRAPGLERGYSQAMPAEPFGLKRLHIGAVEELSRRGGAHRPDPVAARLHRSAASLVR